MTDVLIIIIIFLVLIILLSNYFWAKAVEDIDEIHTEGVKNWIKQCKDELDRNEKILQHDREVIELMKEIEFESNKNKKLAELNKKLAECYKNSRDRYERMYENLREHINNDLY